MLVPKEIIAKLKSDKELNNDKNIREVLKRLAPTMSYRDLMIDIIDYPYSYQSEENNKFLEKTLDLVKQHDKSYAEAFNQAVDQIRSGLEGSKIKIVPYIRTLIDQQKVIGPEFKDDYLKAMATIMLSCFRKSQITEDDKIIINQDEKILNEECQSGMGLSPKEQEIMRKYYGDEELTSEELKELASIKDTEMRIKEAAKTSSKRGSVHIFYEKFHSLPYQTSVEDAREALPLLKEFFISMHEKSKTDQPIREWLQSIFKKEGRAMDLGNYKNFSEFTDALVEEFPKPGLGAGRR